MVTVELPPLSGVLLETATIDLAPPAAPAGLAATAGAGTMTLTWDAPAGAAGYDVYASPLSGGGFVRLNDAPLGDASYAVLEAPAGTRFFVVTALDEVGNESGWSNEVAAPGAA
jgi:hypothetical protein